MRETKFRGKDSKGIWRYGFLDYYNTSFYIHVIEEVPPTWNDPGGSSYSEYFSVDPDTIGELIGILDKNDKEIYEGDIIELSTKSYTYRLGAIDKRWITVIKWNDIRCCFEIYHKSRNLTWMFSDTDFNGKLYVKEIIGNIHENPELLP